MPRTQPLVVLLLLVVLTVVCWLVWSHPTSAPTPGTTTPTADAGAEVDAGGAADRGTAVEDGVPVEQLRTAVGDTASDAPTPAADAKALVRITTRTKAGEIVPHVVIKVSRIEQRRVTPEFARGVTDDMGRFELRDIEPGTLYLRSDTMWDNKRAKVVAGPNEVTFEVEPRLEVAGRVLAPGGATVAGATVWLQTASTRVDGGRVLATTDGDGTFRVADVPPDCSLGAWADGYAPSALVDLDIVDRTASPVRIELRLQQGGAALAGRITDPDGAPIAGAEVAAGRRPENLRHQGKRYIEQWSVRVGVSDEDGRYSLPGLVAGATPVSARAGGFGIFRGEVELEAGATATLDIGLLPAVTLFGTVTDPSGAPETHTLVSVYDREPRTTFLGGGQIDFDEVFGHRYGFTDARGAYRLTDVTPGTAWAFAQRVGGAFGGSTQAFVRTTLELEPGSEQRWDPVIDEGRSIVGVVRYRDGFPIPHLFLTLRDEQSGDEQIINGDAEGGFRFLCLADSTFELRVQPPFDAPSDAGPAPRRAGIVPNRGPVELTVDYDKPVKLRPGTVRGRIDDAAHRIQNANAATVTLSSDASWFRSGIKIEDGAFRIDDVTPCRFRISLVENETTLAYTDWFDLPESGDVDVGMVTTEPAGGLRVRIRRTAGTEEFDPKMYLQRDGAPTSTTVQLGRGNELLVENLSPGSYSIRAYFKGMVSVKQKATVAVATTSDLEIELRPAASGKIDVWWPEDHKTSERRGYRITDPDGNIGVEFEGPLHTASTQPYELLYGLAAGRYRLEFWTDDGLRGELDFTIPPSLEPPTLRLDLK